MGSYQYGRGLDITRGGNYERLMSQDPLRFASPETVDRFVRTLMRDSRSTYDYLAPQGTPDELIEGDEEFLPDGSTGRLGPGTDRVINQLAQEISGTPGGDAVLRMFPPTGEGGESVALVAAALSNYFMSDRDSVTKLPIQNAALQLSEIAPGQDEDTCACRGAEADLLLAVYAAGTSEEAFFSVDGEAAAISWEKRKILEASAPWKATQDAVSGSSEGRSLSQIWDRVAGPGGVVDSFRDAASGQSTAEQRDTLDGAVKGLG